MDEFEKLQKILQSGTEHDGGGSTVSHPSYVSPLPEQPQWSMTTPDSYMVSSKSIPSIPVGVFQIRTDSNGRIMFVLQDVITDVLIRLADTVSDEVVKGILRFWESEESFLTHGILFKRGILLWGPAGSGKTATVNFIIQQIIQLGGVVVLCDDPGLAAAGLMYFRKIEPDRPVVFVMEDIEETIKAHGESKLLSLLDGETQVDKIVYLATTNHPELLGARIVNRPSRFDEVRFIGMPNAMSRRIYLQHVLKNAKDVDLEQWVKDTKGLSIAHLKELMVATQVLGRTYPETLQRLKRMGLQIKSGQELKTPTRGFKVRQEEGPEDVD